MDERLQPLMGAGDGVLAIDGKQRIIFWNESAREILGYESKAVLGQPCWQFFQACSIWGSLRCRPDCQNIQRVLQGQTISPFRVDALTQAGDHVLLEVSAVTFSGGERAGQGRAGQEPVLERPVLLLFFRQLPAQMCPAGKLCLHLLGSLRVSRPDGSPVSGRNWKPVEVRALLAVLAARRGEVVSEQSLQFYLWPDDTQVEREQKLHSAIDNLRLSLEPHLPPAKSSYILQKGAGFYLTGSPHCWLDIETFELGLHRARLEIDWIKAIGLYRQALRLYRGLYVADLPEIICCLGEERERLQQLFLEALEEVGLLFEKLGRCHEAFWFYSLVLEVDPNRIDARRLLYRLRQSADGRQGRLIYSQWLANALKNQLGAAAAPVSTYENYFEPEEGQYENV